MRLSISLFILCFFSALGLANPNLKVMILNGNKVTSDQQFPFVVAIYLNKESDANCTGTLIDPSWVLTASHCVINQDDPDKIAPYPPSAFEVGTGFQAGNREHAEIIRSVRAIYVYGNKKVIAKLHDVALLELSTPLQNTRTLPVLASFYNVKTGNQSATDVGFGWVTIKSWAPVCRTDPNSPDCWFDEDQDTYDHYGSVQIGNDQAIEDSLQAYIKKYPSTDPLPVSYNPDSMIGFTSLSGNHATNGDSGGPLLVKDANNNYVIVGVNSWGTGFNYESYMDHGFDYSPSVGAYLFNPDTHKFIMDTIANH